ncbi:hypothetical protein [Lysinibacillus sp. JNUCC 51]|uniref:hypothetical protein n=1 Tax=Lysinibacillus sp. JNUCC-51 TaxID=2792479 RepID=UPI001937BB16|nr:hypothetical protein JNUCC51_00315 [Lysinibacillus sp. JNUCC-51]
MIIIENNDEKTKVKVLSVFSFGEIPVEYDMSTFPQPENIKGKTYELYYDKETKKLYYKYIDVPKTDIETLQEENEKLKIALTDQDENIMLIMLEMGGN